LRFLLLASEEAAVWTLSFESIWRWSRSKIRFQK
jgi:hypothetical protein